MSDDKTRDVPDQKTYFEDPTTTTEDLAALFESSAALWATQAWDHANLDLLIQVKAPLFGLDDGCLSLLFADDDYADGLALFASLDDARRMLDLDGEDDDDDVDDQPVPSQLMLTFAPEDEVFLSMREEVAKHGLPLGSGTIYPLIARFKNDEPVQVSRNDVLLVTAVARALSALMGDNPAALRPVGKVATRTSSVDDAGRETLLVIPHPDDDRDDEDETIERADTLLDKDNPYELPTSVDPAEQSRALGGLTLHRLVGVCCALASVPRVLPPSSWIPPLADEVLKNRGTDEKSSISAILSVHEAVLDRLADGGLHKLVPVAEDRAACREWARGYADVLDLCSESELENAVEVADRPYLSTRLDLIRSVSEPPDAGREEIPLADKDAALATLRDGLARAARTLGDFWEQARRDPPPPINVPVRRETPKVGRNDACPCGSGKKYKKCCA